MSKKQKKIALLAALILTLIGVINIGADAWFTRKRQTARPVMVEQPQTVFIKAGHAEDIMYLDISDIDVQKDEDGDGIAETSKNFVFCIDGFDFETYTLQFAHTNNIPFTYKFYHATESANKSDATYTSQSGTYYYQKGDELILSQKNIDLDQTYKSNEIGNVQKLAEPSYYQAENIYANNGQPMSSNHFTDYYILEVSWDSSLRNNKETDIVCITVNGETAWSDPNQNNGD